MSAKYVGFLAPIFVSTEFTKPPIHWSGLSHPRSRHFCTAPYLTATLNGSYAVGHNLILYACLLELALNELQQVWETDGSTLLLLPLLQELRPLIMLTFRHNSILEK